MSKFIIPLVSFVNGIPTIEEREAFAVKAGTTLGYLHHVMYGRKTPSAELALAIAEQSNWQVTPHDLRPTAFKNPWDGLPPGFVAPAVREAADA